MVQDFIMHFILVSMLSVIENLVHFSQVLTKPGMKSLHVLGHVHTY